MSKEEREFLDWGLRLFKNGCSMRLTKGAKEAFRKHYAPIARLYRKDPSQWEATRHEVATWLGIQGQAASLSARCQLEPMVDAKNFVASVEFVAEQKSSGLLGGTPFCRLESLPETGE